MIFSGLPTAAWTKILVQIRQVLGVERSHGVYEVSWMLVGCDVGWSRMAVQELR